MKQKLTALLPYALLLCADFYLLPLLIRDTGSAMLLLLAAMPLAAFLLAVLLPSLPLFYNISAWVYGVFYALVVLAGTGVGRLFQGKR